MEVDDPSALLTKPDVNPCSEIDLNNHWQREAQALLSFLPNTFFRDTLIQRLEEVYAARDDLESLLLAPQRRSRIKTQVQECGSIMEGLLNDRLDKDFKKEILKQYARKGNHRVKDIPMNKKADFAAQKGLITEELKKQICDIYRLRSNIHPDREIRTNYVPSTSDAQKAFEILEKFVSQLKAYLDKPKR